jgi:hypothetical protein
VTTLAKAREEADGLCIISITIRNAECRIAKSAFPGPSTAKAPAVLATKALNVSHLVSAAATDD